MTSEFSETLRNFGEGMWGLGCDRCRRSFNTLLFYRTFFV